MTSAVPGNSGALAVPLITAHGCVGVLAAEIKQNRSSTELMPLAKIIAAQFAALMAPSDVPAQRTAQA
jgi:GAF domain-containing protein